MDIELKPCPMCGSDARIRNHRVAGDSLRENLNRVWVECTNNDKCGLRQTMFGYTQEAVPAWNRREAQRWIPVSERLPNRDSVHDVIVRSTDNPTFQRRAVAVPFLNGEFSVTKHASCEYVSHWKALPEMPEFTSGDQQ